MRIGIYSPYLDTAGGGEKYVLTIAEVLSKNHQVDVFLDENLYRIGIDLIKSKISKLHNLDLTRINFINAPLGKGSNFFSKFFFLKKYDYFFYNTDGSIFYSTAKNNIVHFQVPFKNIATKGLWGNFKLSSWKIAIYNSKFTRDIVEETWNIEGKVIYPPVSIDQFKTLKKKKQIISVGRFVGDSKVKKQPFLIENFKKLIKENNLKDWSLILIGGARESDRGYLDSLKKESRGFSIKIIPNASFDELKVLYGESSIHWHATGYKETDPVKMEHFGITTVEAMAAGCVPIVINLGGQPEIVEQGECGFLWNTLDELIDYTMEVINDKKLFERLSKNAVQRSRNFSKNKFEENILGLLT